MEPEKASAFEAALGLTYSIKYLASIKDSIAHMSLEDQSRFADGVTKKRCSDESFLRGTLASTAGSVDTNVDYSQWNATSVGNLAYILLHSTAMTPTQKTYLTSLLDGFKNWAP